MWQKENCLQCLPIPHQPQMSATVERNFPWERPKGSGSAMANAGCLGQLTNGTARTPGESKASEGFLGASPFLSLLARSQHRSTCRTWHWRCSGTGPSPQLWEHIFRTKYPLVVELQFSVCFAFYIVRFLFIIIISHLNRSFLSLLSSNLPPPPLSSPSTPPYPISIQKTAGLPWIVTKRGIPNCSKTRHPPPPCF